MVEENTSEPPPPDIRPYGRITQQDEHCASRIAVDQLGDQEPISVTRHVDTRRSRRTRSNLLNARVQSILCLLFIAAIFLPTASAHDDAFTSPPMHTRTHFTPILSSLSSALAYAQSIIDHVINSDPATRGGAAAGYNHLAKRESLSGGEIAEICVIPLLVLLSGTFAGLTLGYFSVDPTQLQVLSISGTPKQQEYARRILPVRKDSHLLLTTLILCNMIVNEALPVVFDNVVSNAVIATVASTALVVVFAEIIPQSICSRYGLLVGATMAWPVRILIWFAYPIAWPIAKLLEYILGAHHGIIYRRSELRELIKIHAAGGEGGGDLDLDTVTMAQGALDLAQKTVKEAMTPIDRVFMLPIEAKLDYETLGHVVRSGHSRIPVYQMVEVPDIDLTAPTLGPAKTKMVKKVIGSLLVKSCVLLDPEDATPLASIPINAIPSVPWDEPLTNMLNVFQEGRSHMAIVSRRGKRVEKDVEDAESVMTAAAGGLKQKFMRKVAEISHHHGKGSTTSGSEGGITSGSDTEGEDVEKAEKKKKKQRTRSKSHSSPTKEKPSEAAKVKEEVEADKKKRSITQAAKLNQLEQSVPADAQLPPESVDKFFEGLEGAPLGIITLEDVLEELIGEEIYDEYDEHGGPRNAASAFIPREAALAARQAALNREKAAAAAAVATPLAPNADAGLETSGTAAAPTNRRVAMPKLPTMPRFGLSKRPTSQPGRSRAPIAELTPVNPAPVLAQTDKFTAEPVEQADALNRSASGPDLTSTTAGDPGSEISGTKPPSRAASGNALDALDDAAVDTTSAQPIASAIPARMLAVPGTGSTSSAPAATTSNATLLSEALLLERSRRRLVAQAGSTGTSTPPIGGVPSMIRAASASGTPRVSSGGLVPPQPAQAGRVPTPPSGPPSTKAIPPPASQVASAGILSPQPRRAPKFKSVPTPVAGTPVPGEKQDGSLEMAKVESKAKEPEE